MSPPDSMRLPDGPEKQSDEKPNVSAKIAAAQRYAARGWPVYPARPGKRGSYATKRDTGQRWGASIDHDLIASYFSRWLDADIGIATGNGLLVIDVDTVEGHGRDGYRTLSQNPDLLMWTRRATTPSGGEHHYLLLPPGIRVRSSTGGLGPGVDIISENYSVIAPPACGRQWITRCEPTVASEQLISQLRKRGLVVSAIDPTLAAMMNEDAGKGLAADDYGPDDDPGAKLCYALAVIDPDIEYTDWFKIGAGIHHALGDAGLKLWDEWSALGRTYPGRRAIEDKWRECCKIRSITAATVYRVADDYNRDWRALYAAYLRDGRRT